MLNLMPRTIWKPHRFLRNMALAVICATDLCAGSGNVHAQLFESSNKTKYLSDSDAAYHWLEERQRQLLTATPFRVPGLGDVGQVRASIKDLYLDNSFGFSGGPTRADQVKLALEAQLSRPFPTRYEHPDFYTLLMWQSILIESTIDQSDPRSEFKLEQSPFLGSLPLPSLNATAMHIRGSDKRLVAVNWGMIVFLIDLTELALQTVQVQIDPGGKTLSIKTDNEDFRRRLVAMPQLKDQLMQMLLFNYGSSKSNPQPQSASNELFAFGSISRAILLYALAHEYGHILAKHEATSEADRFSSEAQVLVHSWAQELEADIIGSQLLSAILQQAAREVPRQQMFLGFHLVAPLVLYEFLRIEEEAKYVIQNSRAPKPLSPLEYERTMALLDLALQDISGRAWREPSLASAFGQHSSHPPAWIRFELASRNYEKQYRGLLTDQRQRELAGLAIALGRNMHELWTATIPAFVDLVRKDGR